MTMNPLPPQAYTKDTLTKAYLWLLHQNDSIKELATTPDVLVTLFLKAQRNGDDSLDTPSIQNFKNELKSLAGLMGELEGKPRPSSPRAEPLTQTPPAQTQPTVSASSSTRSAPKATPPSNGAFSMPQNPTNHQTTNPEASTHMPPFHSASNGQSSLPIEIIAQLDVKSRAMVGEVREQLNLGSDVEVLRLLISLGYKKARNLYS